MKYILSILAIGLVIGGGILFWKSRENTSPRIQVEENISSVLVKKQINHLKHKRVI